VERFRRYRALLEQSKSMYPTRDLQHKWVRAKMRLGSVEPRVKITSGWQYDPRYYRFG
jgi:hypothetical protein